MRAECDMVKTLFKCSLQKGLKYFTFFLPQNQVLSFFSPHENIKPFSLKYVGCASKLLYNSQLDKKEPYSLWIMVKKLKDSLEYGENVYNMF